MSEYIVRFLVGGLVVSSFAVLGEIFRPKSFAGIFGAAPSIALATFGAHDRKRRKGLRGNRSALHDFRRDGLLRLRLCRQLHSHAI